MVHIYLDPAYLGLYVISGAQEDVLLISQTTSGQKYFVPRLEAHVVGISQTNSGSKYLLNLSNNSLKLINAATFELETEISGLRCPASDLRPGTVGFLHPSKSVLFLGPGTE